MLRYANDPPAGLLDAIEAGATFHDLGKLDPDIQNELHKGRGSKLRWDHIDAGVAHLSSLQSWMAAWLVRAHHAPGLPQKIEHFDPDGVGRRLRGRRYDIAPKEKHDEQIRRTDSFINQYLAGHEAAVGAFTTKKQRPIHGLTMRLALSCLVDADHTDSAFYDSGQAPPDPPEALWEKRLHALCEYVTGLPPGLIDSERSRNQRRNEFFQACLNSKLSEHIVACEGAVGLGKTTAVTAYLIRRAKEEGLRRLLIVAPYTNILTQTAARLRKALVLPGENPYEVVVEHHHRADFSNIEDRDLAVLWRAPIIVTTAVSFFETLASCHPANLRKLHAIPGSVIFIDEAHAALPIKLWPQNWKWIRELAERWGCRFVFASGSLMRFWEHKEIVDQPITLPDLLPREQAVDVMTDEQQRVKFYQVKRGHVIEISELLDMVNSEAGPRLVILNTVQNAAVIAKTLRESGMDVLHLSTALTPRDRSVIFQKIEKKLETKNFQDWTLVATSCVEAGVDFSFRCAFRERFCVASTIQVGGRINRHGEYTEVDGGKVYDFALTGKGITQHPAASGSSDILRDLMGKNMLNTHSPADIVTLAMTELRRQGSLSNDFLKAESERDYPRVNELGKVIDADTRFVIVDPHLRCLIEDRRPVNFKTLLDGSVQLWAQKIEKLRLDKLPGRGEIYVWNYDYEPDFLGYMKGVLKMEDFISSGGAII
ncbi:MAG TPA: DEAD/DEAH box helicase [Syntrophales bacterium]|nr:DEAD/DEAH box helicase [Syntrophales bacterium]